MRTINDLKEGDSIWLRVQYGTTYRTKEVRQATVRHIVRDDELFSKLTSLRQDMMRIIEFDGASRIHYSPEKGDTDVYSTNGISNVVLTYYTDKSKLLADLEREKMKLLEGIDALIRQVK